MLGLAAGPVRPRRTCGASHPPSSPIVETRVCSLEPGVGVRSQAGARRERNVPGEPIWRPAALPLDNGPVGRYRDTRDGGAGTTPRDGPLEEVRDGDPGHDADAAEVGAFGGDQLRSGLLVGGNARRRPAVRYRRGAARQPRQRPLHTPVHALRVRRHLSGGLFSATSARSLAFSISTDRPSGGPAGRSRRGRESFDPVAGSRHCRSPRRAMYAGGRIELGARIQHLRAYARTAGTSFAAVEPLVEPPATQS